MFSIGDKIVYGGMGVCTVLDIGVPDLPGAERECYILKPHHVANAKVYAPLKGNPVIMRALLTPEEAQTLIDSMPELSFLPECKEKQEMTTTYRDVMKSTDSLRMARLLKTLYERKLQVLSQKKVLPSALKEHFDTTERVLFGELAVSLEMPIEDMKGYIETRVGSSYGLQEVAAS